MAKTTIDGVTYTARLVERHPGETGPRHVDVYVDGVWAGRGYWDSGAQQIRDVAITTIPEEAWAELDSAIAEEIAEERADADALDAMARDAGYRDQAHAAEAAGAFEGTVEEVDGDALARGVERLNATKLKSGEYAYFDDETSAWYVVDESDVESLAADYMDSDDEAIARDAYSHWCAGTTAREATREELVELGQDVHCECGGWSGEWCCWFGPASETVLVEWMPDHLRASHLAAGNRGVYPHNGALRGHVSHECAEAMIESDGDWCSIVSR